MLCASMNSERLKQVEENEERWEKALYRIPAHGSLAKINYFLCLSFL